jgi:hypothetical protein
MDRHAATAACGAWLRPLVCGSPGRILICFATPSSRPCSMLAWTCGTSRSPRGTLIHAPRCGTAGPARTLTATQLHPGRLHGLRHLTAQLSYSMRCI